MRNGRPGIVLVGAFGSGKTTIATALTEFGYQRYSFAKPLKDFLALAYGPINKDGLYSISPGEKLRAVVTGREMLQRFGTDVMRDQFDADFWVRAAERELTSNPSVDYVIDDMRFKNEYALLRRFGFYMVRLIGRGIEVPEGERAHVSESMHEQFPVHLTISNVEEPRFIASEILASMETSWRAMRPGGGGDALPAWQEEAVAATPFNHEEQAAWDAISAAFTACRALSPYNQEELATAVHILQAFPIQSLLHRNWPDVFSDWIGPKE